MITEREQLYIDSLRSVRKLTGGGEVFGKELAELVSAVQVLLPVWDTLMPLLVADIVAAVKKANV